MKTLKPLLDPYVSPRYVLLSGLAVVKLTFGEEVATIRPGRMACGAGFRDLGFRV